MSYPKVMRKFQLAGMVRRSPVTFRSPSMTRTNRPAVSTADRLVKKSLLLHYFLLSSTIS